MAAQSKAAIVAAARSAIGTARKGSLANMEPIEIAKPIVAAAVERSGLDPTDFEDLILAESLQGGGDSARYIAVDLVKQKLKVDDSLDVFGVHGVGGIIGALPDSLVGKPAEVAEAVRLADTADHPASHIKPEYEDAEHGRV